MQRSKKRFGIPVIFLYLKKNKKSFLIPLFYNVIQVFKPQQNYGKNKEIKLNCV